MDNLEKELKTIVNLLNVALETNRFIMFRSRFASKEQWEEEGPHLQKKAYMAWLSAKLSIGENREIMEKTMKESELYSEYDKQTFAAALKTIDKELETLIEQDLLKEET